MLFFHGRAGSIVDDGLSSSDQSRCRAPVGMIRQAVEVRSYRIEPTYLPSFSFPGVQYHAQMLIRRVMSRNPGFAHGRFERVLVQQLDGNRLEVFRIAGCVDEGGIEQGATVNGKADSKDEC